MSSGMMHQQETTQDSPSGSAPRFRPFPSANHHLTKGRYITSNDARGYIPVYEYPLNGQWIMMDIDDGYILWTGIWKALGNSKADIVKMIDSQPDLAPLIRRVRGGYLKIQGTWMPYEVALKLSKRVAWAIRDDLVPLFGPDFPKDCLSPDQPGYGQVVPSGNGRRRARRATQPSTLMQQIPRVPAGWTVVTPSTSTGSTNFANPPHDQLAAYMPHPNQRPYTPTHDYSRSHSHQHPHQTELASPSTMGSPYMSHPQSPMGGEGYNYHHHPQHRYSSGAVPPYGSASHPPTSFRKYSAPNSSSSSSTSSRMGLSIDIRGLPRGMDYRGPPSSSATTPLHTDDDKEAPVIRLPPIRAPDGAPRGDYALPPISAMQNGHDSAAEVLRRLKMDDESSFKGSQDNKVGENDDSRREDGPRRHSLSSHPPSSMRGGDTSPRFQPYASPRSYQDHLSSRRPRSSSSAGQSRRQYSSHHTSATSSRDDMRSQWTESHEGDSNSNPSPISPATPNSPSECSLTMLAHAAYTGTEKSQLGAGTGRLSAAKWSRSPSPQGSRRNSYELQSAASAISQPHRPW